MRFIAALTVASACVMTTPGFAQTTDRSTTTTPAAPNPSNSNLPESMRIQNQTERQYFNSPVAPNAGGTTTEAPGNASSPLEQGRIDPAAPSRQRLQIDQGQSARARENPDATSTKPNAQTGSSYNTIIRGAPSSSGTSPGVSGSSGAGGNSGASGSSTSGSSGGSSSGGGSH